ncbi:MAG: LysR substrate-binding domain-containing protein [Gemmatimonadaceae bacterium]|nr:LysR substrate-binding domain-containing protein [Gemmatimonadaceae bacterium]
MELRHLRYFVAVADAEHVGRAAAQLRVAQPALSRQLQDLERDVGVPLFAREKRRLRLTDAGRDFLDHARGLLAQVDCAVASARRVARGLSGELVVGFVEAATASGALPAAVASFATRAPHIRVQLREATSAEQVEALRRKTIDVGLLYIAPDADDPALDVETLWQDPLVAVVPSGHRLAGRRAATLSVFSEGVDGAPLVLFRRALAPERHDAVLRACASSGYRPSRVVEATHFQSVLGLVAGGVGVGLVPSSMRAMRHAGVSYVALSDLRVPFAVSLATRRDNPLPAVRTMIEEMRSAVTATHRGIARIAELQRAQ